MSDRQRLLLSPYRLPTHHQVYLNEEEMAAWLNGYMVLWHPVLLFGGSKIPKVDSAYDHEQPVAGRAYVLPDSPPQFLPDDWADRVTLQGALRLEALTDRQATVQAMLDAVRAAGQTDEGRDHFGTPEQLQLLDVPMAQVRPFFGLGFGYLMIDSLFEAMDHERLLDTAGFWDDIQQALQALLRAADDDMQTHLRAAASKLLAAREVLYSVNIHVLDVWQLDESTLDAPFPAAVDLGIPCNMMTTGRTLEQLAEQHPERVQTLRAKLDEAVQPPTLEVIGGIYREREDALLPIASQLWNLHHGRTVTRDILGVNVEVLARKKSAHHPQIPAWVHLKGFRRALLLSFDGAVVPTYRATVINWTSHDGKSIDAYTRMPNPAHKAETFFNLVYNLHQSISQDTAPTLALLHQGQPANALYDDWLALSQLGPVLGQWTTFSRYFSDALAGEYVGTMNPDDFFTDYLEERVTARRADVVSAFAGQARYRRRLDAAWTLAAIDRALSGPPSDDDVTLLTQLQHTENRIETAGIDAIPGTDAAAGFDPELPWAKKITERLQARAAANQPGFMVLNPCAFTRRVALELEGVSGPLPIADPIKAAQFDSDRARLVVEIPPLGFAWIPAKGPANAAAPKQRIRLADGNIVRNEYFEAEIDPQTGGLKAFRDVRTQVPRVGMQLVYNPGSRTEGRSVKVVHNGAALGEVQSEGVIFNEQNEEIATFRLRLRAWLTRPILDIRIELDALHMPAGYPWHGYYGARVAWRDERSAVLRGANGVPMQTAHTRPVTPDFLDIKLGRQGTTLFTGGLPFHQRQGPRMVDVILVPEAEEGKVFELGLALDRDYPMQIAQGMISPVAVVPTTKGPPHVGPTGWLFQIDSPNLFLLNLRPTADGQRSFIMTLLETSGVHGGMAEMRCLRNPSHAALLDGDDQPTMGLSIEGDAVRLEFAAGELFRVRVDLS